MKPSERRHWDKKIKTRDNEIDKLKKELEDLKELIRLPIEQMEKLGHQLIKIRAKEELLDGVKNK